MTFFNKKTEVMQIEMTPYGRYLYSIGKFKPHSYEFVDDDVVYRTSGSGELQESAHQRIINETPKLKINRAFQDEAPEVISPPVITQQRVMVKRNNLRQSGMYPMGRSSYSSDLNPEMQVRMFQGKISGSHTSFLLNEANSHGDATGSGPSVLIPQIDVDLEFHVSLKNSLSPQDDYDGLFVQSSLFQDGTYIEIRYTEPIIHLKEFNSFYEKENFVIETFLISGSRGNEELTPLKMIKNFSNVKNDILLEDGEVTFYDSNVSYGGFDSISEFVESDYVEHFFDLEFDEAIPPEVLCKVVNSLEINSQFLDEELICPDQRTERFDIYSTRVTPDDLEDCD